ncbi:PilZ domain-containing protein [Polynucleobacter sp. VK25]|uniref:PilZ domain-containing protein n=1 Tax=Polynucleobacter sp. VK25 TaxID=1758398 RepID=UPI001BFE796E|nr:PilZ domain-containing protein [Polynucleobacter sp. VK25]QWD67576.1 PilZ domain-containing protein [Polynucleobacter sp. VK25]
MVKVNPARKSIAKDRSPRVKAEFPVYAPDGAQGLTKDISATGIFLELDSKQKPGSIISFWVELDTPGAKMKLICEAKVVRVEQEDGKTKLGTKIISQELQALTP